MNAVTGAERLVVVRYPNYFGEGDDWHELSLLAHAKKTYGFTHDPDGKVYRVVEADDEWRAICRDLSTARERQKEWLKRAWLRGDAPSSVQDMEENL